MIFACGYNGELGLMNDLLWSLPKDMGHFVRVTKGKNVFMGRKTYESLPESLVALLGRSNFVISSNPKKVAEEYGWRTSKKVAGMRDGENYQARHSFNAESSLEGALKKADSEKMNPGYHDKENIIIGGGGIYEYALNNNLVGIIYRTVVHQSFPIADVRMSNMKLGDYGFSIINSQQFAPDQENKYGMTIEKWVHNSRKKDLLW